MCGIIAQFSKNSEIIRGLFTESLKLLNHRGPDDINQLLLRNNSLCFGHTRLSTIGLNNGLQPLSNPDKTVFAIINGEFYDYKKIKENFSAEGYNFTTDTDSEIILALYKKYKYDCFSQLNGEFAGIIYDSIDDKLIIFRDRHGVKPLFIRNSASDVIIASEIKAILHADTAQPEWDVTYAKQFLCWVNTQNHTIFKDIYHVKPSHYMIFDLKTHAISEHRYWKIDFNRNNYLKDSLPDLANQYKTEFVAAVSRRLCADVPVAIYLSGGIDSSACYGVASTLAGKGLDAFTISFDNPDYDEFKQAQKLVRQYGGKQHVLTVGEKRLLDNFEQHLWYTEGMVFNPHSVAKYLLSDLVHQSGFKVVITGEGSDEYNAGYVTSMVDAAKFEYNGAVNLSSELFNISAGGMVNRGAKALDYLEPIFGFSPNLLENAVVAHRFFNQLYAARYQEHTPDIDIECWTKVFHCPEMASWDPLNISLYITGQILFPYVLSVLGDRTEMAHSIEARVPFLDHYLLDFLAKVPPKYKATLCMDKFLLREAVKDFVTPEHYMTHKHPYRAPPFLTKTSLFAHYMHDTFSSIWFKNAGLFDQNKVLGLLKTTINQNKANPEMEKQLFKILSFAVLHKIYRFKNL